MVSVGLETSLLAPSRLFDLQLSTIVPQVTSLKKLYIKIYKVTIWFMMIDVYISPHHCGVLVFFGRIPSSAPLTHNSSHTQLISHTTHLTHNSSHTKLISFISHARNADQRVTGQQMRIPCMTEKCVLAFYSSFSTLFHRRCKSSFKTRSWSWMRRHNAIFILNLSYVLLTKCPFSGVYFRYQHVSRLKRQPRSLSPSHLRDLRR